MKHIVIFALLAFSPCLGMNIVDTLAAERVLPIEAKSKYAIHMEKQLAAPWQPIQQQKLFKAIATNDVPAAQAALDAGAKINEDVEACTHIRTRDGIIDGFMQTFSLQPYTFALRLFPEYKNFSMLALLAAYGPDINAKSENRITALIETARLGNAMLMRIVLEHKPDINSLITGSTALITAAGKGHLKCVQILLEHGADPELRTALGDNRAIEAAYIGNKGVIVRKLLLAGACYDIKRMRMLKELDRKPNKAEAKRCKKIFEATVAYLKQEAIAAIEPLNNTEPYMRIVAEYLFGELKPNSQIGDT